MKKYLHLSICVFVIFFATSTYAAFIPASLSQAKDSIKEYYESGEHEVQLWEIAAKAKEKLFTSKKSSSSSKKLAIVIDIDDTALNNYPIMKKYDFSQSNKVWDIIQKSTSIPANPPILDLYKYAQKLGYHTFFITARLQKYNDSTAKAIQNAGFKNYDGLFLITKKYENMPFNEFKTDIRRKLSNDGYNIIVNIGDQYSDLDGGYAKYTFKVPNYMYGSY